MSDTVKIVCPTCERRLNDAPKLESVGSAAREWANASFWLAAARSALADAAATKIRRWGDWREELALLREEIAAYVASAMDCRRRAKRLRGARP